jgi:hypothetical protein
MRSSGKLRSSSLLGITKNLARGLQPSACPFGPSHALSATRIWWNSDHERLALPAQRERPTLELSASLQEGSYDR